MIFICRRVVIADSGELELFVCYKQIIIYLKRQIQFLVLDHNQYRHLS